MPTAQTVTIRIGETEIALTFDVAKLLDIERRMNASLFETAEKLQPMLPMGDELDGQAITPEAKAALSEEDRNRVTASAAERRRAMAAFRFGFAADFVAACTGRSATDLLGSAPNLLQLTGELAAPFFGALSQLVTGGEDAPAHPTPAADSAPAAPGPASTSA